MPAADVHPTSRQHPGYSGCCWPCRSGFGDIRGQNAASALTLSLFLSIFPLILVAVSVLGFRVGRQSRTSSPTRSTA
jgi:uncharacterized BrkB/YihY/UPF0761 family membrane protein